ncbi:hypothetical protein GW17_00044731 [Ensete ventricosum]|nr:hypothetical protein GW17_00044731 [Ensete ventricosum]
MLRARVLRTVVAALPRRFASGPLSCGRCICRWSFLPAVTPFSSNLSFLSQQRHNCCLLCRENLPCFARDAVAPSPPPTAYRPLQFPSIVISLLSYDSIFRTYCGRRPSHPTHVAFLFYAHSSMHSREHIAESVIPAGTSKSPSEDATWPFLTAEDATSIRTFQLCRNLRHPLLPLL